MTSRGQNLPRAKTKTSLTTRKKPQVVRTVPEYVPMHYSDALMVQQKDAMFVISYLQTKYPLVVTDAEIKQVEHIEQRCIAQIIVTPPQLARNLAVLNNNFKNFIEGQDPKTQEHLISILNSLDKADENSKNEKPE
jgi:alpha-ketoglutarate-dependent taurine dioxygenase